MHFCVHECRSVHTTRQRTRALSLPLHFHRLTPRILLVESQPAGMNTGRSGAQAMAGATRSSRRVFSPPNMSALTNARKASRFFRRRAVASSSARRLRGGRGGGNRSM